MRKLHVMHVIQRFALGGLENGLINLINGLPEDHYEHTILVLSKSSEFALRLKTSNFNIIELDLKPGPLAKHFHIIYKHIKKRRPDVLHTRNLSTLECQGVGWVARVPYRLHSEHGRDAHDIHGVHKKHKLIRKLYKPIVHQYIALSKDLESYLNVQIKVLSGSVKQIYNGVDTDIFKPSENKEEGLVIATAGRLNKVKDYPTLIQAFANVHAKHPKCVLKIFGEGPEKPKLQSLVKELNLTDSVIFVGEHSRLWEALPKSHIYVQTSLFEGISNTILEAMASGLSVIATQVGGNKELIQSNKTGLLIDIQDVEATAARMLYLIENPKIARALGASARASVESKFSLNKMIEAYHQIYQKPNI